MIFEERRGGAFAKGPSEAFAEDVSRNVASEGGAELGQIGFPATLGLEPPPPPSEQYC